MLATRQPVLRRFWYPVMPATLVDQGPQPFTLLDERIVLWKDGSGHYAAMADRCPHRSAQLSKGWVDGDVLARSRTARSNPSAHGQAAAAAS